MRVDTVLVNGVIHTGMQPAPVSALAIQGDRIVAVGADCDGLDATRRVDLAGLAVVPGFHDAHNHMAWFGASLDELNLSSPPLDAGRGHLRSGGGPRRAAARRQLDHRQRVRPEQAAGMPPAP